MRAKMLLLLLVFTAPLWLLDAQEKPAPTRGPELTPAESRQLDRITDLYAEVAQQIAEAQARLKVLAEMQQKLAADFQAFQTIVLAARGHKPGQAALDVQLRKVVPVSVKPEASSR